MSGWNPHRLVQTGASKATVTGLPAGSWPLTRSPSRPRFSPSVSCKRAPLASTVQMPRETPPTDDRGRPDRVADGACARRAALGPRLLPQRRRHRPIGPAPVEVVGVADGEGAVDGLPSDPRRGRDHGEARAPGAGAAGGRVADQVRVRQRLVDVADFGTARDADVRTMGSARLRQVGVNMPAMAAVARRAFSGVRLLDAEMLLERRLQSFLNHEHDSREAGQRRIVDRVVQQRLAAWTDGGQLLEASEAGGSGPQRG